MEFARRAPNLLTGHGGFCSDPASRLSGMLINAFQVLAPPAVDLDSSSVLIAY